MNFLGCDGVWMKQSDGNTVCDGQLRTYTVQEMRDYLSPALTMQQKAELTGAVIALLTVVWVLKKLQSQVWH
jgi:hypothetical protein